MSKAALRSVATYGALSTLGLSTLVSGAGQTALLVGALAGVLLALVMVSADSQD